MSQRRSITVARQASLRSTNLALAASRVFAADEPVARVDVARSTGMTRSTASRLIDELVESGILKEEEPRTSNHPGRPAVPLSPASGHYFALGLEVNVSHLAVRLMDLSGTVAAQQDLDGEFIGSAPREVLGTLARLARECLSSLPRNATLTGAQIALPGLVDSSRNLLLRAPNLRWDNVDVFGLLANEGLEELDTLTCSMANEADCAAMLFARTAPGRRSEHTNFLYLSGEVGIGAALVRDGQLSLGQRGWAGEIGHTCIDPSGPACGCGATGCLEQYAGTRALLARAGASTVDELLARDRAGDPASNAALRVAADALALAVANAANLMEVTTVVLGGDLARFAHVHEPRIVEELDRRLLIRPFVEPRVVSTIPDHAAPALGAATIALERVIADPSRWIPERASSRASS